MYFTGWQFATCVFWFGRVEQCLTKRIAVLSAKTLAETFTLCPTISLHILFDTTGTLTVFVAICSVHIFLVS